MNPQTRNALIFWGVLIAIGAAIGGYFGIDYLIKSNKIKPFNNRIAEFTAVTAAPAPAGQQGPFRAANAKPKMIIIDLGKQQVDWAYFDLPREMQADNPDQVETVVGLRWSEERLWEYDGGGFGIRHVCNVSVFDKASKQMIAQSTVQGGEPPRETKTSAGSNDYGSKPNKEIVTYLKTVAGR
jgi:hypothetical protein